MLEKNNFVAAIQHFIGFFILLLSIMHTIMSNICHTDGRYLALLILSWSTQTQLGKLLLSPRVAPIQYAPTLSF
jgi:hypothetical protein